MIETNKEFYNRRQVKIDDISELRYHLMFKN